MTSPPAAPPGGTDEAAYEIRVRGRLDRRWSAWFGDLALTRQPDGTTLLEGLVPDQAALHGLLQKIRDLGLPLVSVTRHDPTPEEPHP